MGREGGETCGDGPRSFSKFDVYHNYIPTMGRRLAGVYMDYPIGTATLETLQKEFLPRTCDLHVSNAPCSLFTMHIDRVSSLLTSL